MADKMDRGLDEIIADTTQNNGSRGRRGGGGGGGRRRERQEPPRDGVRKSNRDETRNLDSEWVHDRFEENNSRRAPAPRRRRDSPEQDSRVSKIRVENIHYDLTEEDLDELFKRIGPVVKLQLRYDRAGRSEGTAFVTYELKEDAVEAVRQFDGANANGQPIRLTLLPSGPSRNPFDSAVMPSRPLAERISTPGGRSRSMSPTRRYDAEEAARKGIDRYIPGRDDRSRSPRPARRRDGGRDCGRDGGRGGGRGGRRPGARHEGGRGGRGQDGAKGGQGNPRQKKTQEELDAEMENYFGGGGSASSEQPANDASQGAAEPAPAAAPVQADDIDMIE